MGLLLTIVLSGTTTKVVYQCLGLIKMHEEKREGGEKILKCKACASDHTKLSSLEIRELKFDNRYVRPILVVNKGEGIIEKEKVKKEEQKMKRKKRREKRRK